MDLILTDEQHQIAQAVRELLAHEASSAATRRAAFGHGGFDAALWQKLAELGALGVHLPQAHGGLSLGITELVLVAECLGQHLACVPWMAHSVLAGTTLLLVDDAAVSQRLMPGLASGQCRYAVDIGLLASPAVAALRRHNGWQLDGVLPAVPGAAQAHTLLLLAHTDDAEPLLVALDLARPGVQVQTVPTHDATRPVARVALQAVRVEPQQVLQRGHRAQRSVNITRQVACVALGAEQVGVAQQCLDLSVAYLQQRVQFGKPLASFQALKHRCAHMMASVELARSAVLGAARMLDDRPDAAGLLRAAAMARSLADEAAQGCTQEAIQLHGGAGFTWEFDPQLYFKRAQAARHWLGTPEHWRERAAALWLDEAAA